MNSNKKRSPLDRSMPLRSAGDSITEQIDLIKDDKLLTPLLAAVLTAFLAATEWIRYLNNSTPSPKTFTVLAIIAFAYLAYKFRGLRDEVRQLKLGRDGERLVATYLEELRIYGFTVFHDVPTGDANVDHIIIGTKGVFTVETKTMLMPSRGDVKIKVANGKIYANGNLLQRNPLIQAKAQANWLKNFLKESGFEIKSVWPVVAFPGWFVEPFNWKDEMAWVVEPKMLQGKIEKQSDRYSPEQVSAMVSALRSYVRFKLEKQTAIN